MERYAIGLDTGGTYTDIVLFDLDKKKVRRKAKVPTTHHDYRICLEEALAALSLNEKESKQLIRVGLSTTLATNAIAEDQLGQAGLFLEPADIQLQKPIHDKQILLSSCMDYMGYEIKPVSKDEVLKAADQIIDEVEAFAVSTYAATRNCCHEDEIASILSEAYRKPVVKAYELSHQFNFIQRAHAAVLNAGLLSKMRPWQKELCEVFKKVNQTLKLYMVSGDGSLMTLEEAEQSPVKTILSGPASSLIGGAFLSNCDSAYVIDVGGTTLDIGLIEKGRGELCEGAAMVQGKKLAIDTLNAKAYGLGGDSRLIRGKHGLEFSNQRVRPFARAKLQEQKFDFAAIEKELELRWMMRDIEWLECLDYDKEYHETKLTETFSRLKDGPWPWRMFEQSSETDRLKASLIEDRILHLMALTPTDLACVSEWELPYPKSTSEHAFTLYAKMLDVSKEDLIDTLQTQLHRQVLKVLLHHLCDLSMKNELAYDHEQSFLKCLKPLANESAPSSLSLDAKRPMVILGAAGPMFFANMPESIKNRLQYPEDGDVANAIGAVCAQFVFRDEGVIELKRYRGADVVLHHGRESFESLEEAELYIEKTLRANLEGKAQQLALLNCCFDIQREEIEVPLDFNKGSRLDEIRYSARLEGQVPD